MTLLEIKRALRQGKYAWPGGYPLYFIADDGESLSFEAVRDNWREVVSAHLNQSRCGWLIVAVDVNWEDASLYCAHTNARIESAYADD